MKNTITLTRLGSSELVLAKGDVRVVENLSGGGSLIILQDNTQFHVVERADDVLELLKAKE